jgi:hypothetical protein
MNHPLLAGLIILAGCSGNQAQNQATALTGYDAAVTAEITYLKSAKFTPQEAQILSNLRVGANQAVDAYVAASQAGASNTAQLLSVAQAAVAAYLAEATAAGK